MTKEEFKAIRIDLDMTQKQFADYLGIKNYQTIQKYERGEWKVSGRVVRLLSEKG